jgi:hypothetical protein
LDTGESTPTGGRLLVAKDLINENNVVVEVGGHIGYISIFSVISLAIMVV